MVCNFGLKKEIHWERSAGRSSEGGDLLVCQAKEETRWSLKQTCQLLWVCAPAVALLHKKSRCHKRKICANSFWLYSYFTQASPSKNKNINYIFMYLRVFFVVCPAVQYTTVVSEFELQSQYYIHFQTNTLGKYTNPHHPQLWVK